MYWLRLCLFIVAIAAQVDKRKVFIEDEETLSKCIENYLKNNDDPYYRDLKTLKDIADLAAKRFHGKYEDFLNFDWATKNFYYYVRDKHPHLFNDSLAVKPLKGEIKDALIGCVEQETSRVPDFKHEPAEIGALLDYILVVWPKPLHLMVLTRDGRSLLRRYAEDALSRLAYALIAVNNHGCFRHLLRYYWMIRAEYYFDGRDAQIPYPRHRYSLRHPYPHTYDDFNSSLARNSLNIPDRNPWVSAEDYLRIMNIHIPNRPGYGENDVFSIYERNNGMRSAEYYIETHIDQFYRIIFFYMELQIRGLSRDEDDDYMGQWPGNVMPEQKILRTDFAYRNYLLKLRKQLEQSQVRSGNMLMSARVMEEDLVTLYSIQIQQQNTDCGEFSGHERTSDQMSNTTPRSRPPKREGSFETKKSGKNCKRPKPSCSGESQQQQAIKNGGECQNSNTIGPFPEEESSVFMNTVRLTMTESQISGWHGL